MTGPKSLRSLLAAYVPAGGRVAGGSESGILGASWPDAVGADVARRTRAAGFRDGTLTVLTPSSAWSHQLTFLAPTIIERLRERCPGVDLRRLRFVVATGRSRLLLRGDAATRASNAQSKAGSKEPAASGAIEKAADASVDDDIPASDDLEGVLARLRRAQARLDERRTRAGWRRCNACGCWTDDRAVAPRCAVCRQQARAAADGAIAGSLAGAPWLTHVQLRRELPAADARSYARVRRALMTRWEQQLFHARARLRRDAIDASDRVVAWSYVMLATQRRQEDVSDAMLASVIGRHWGDALRRADESGTRVRKAPRPAREKSTK
jgi:predicted nucleic acid-binding Zn ribbon protein